MAVIIDGKAVAAAKKSELSAEVALLKEKGINPSLAVILVGDDPASAVYVRNKHRTCLELGIESIEIKLPSTATEEEVIEKINELNLDDSVHGILVQLPLRWVNKFFNKLVVHFVYCVV